MRRCLWLSHGEHEATEPFQAPEGTHKAVQTDILVGTFPEPSDNFSPFPMKHTKTTQSLQMRSAVSIPPIFSLPDIDSRSMPNFYISPFTPLRLWNGFAFLCEPKMTHHRCS